MKEPSTVRKKAIIVSMGQVASRFIAIGLLMIMARYLNKTDLAAYRQAFLAVAVIIPLISLGLDQGISYFLPVEENRVRGRIVDATLLLSLMGVFYAIFIAVGGNHYIACRFENPKLAQLLLWMIPYSLVTLPSLIFNPVLVALDQSSKAALFLVLKQFFIGVGTLLPLLIWHNVEATLIGNVVASVIMGGVSLMLMFKAAPEKSEISARPSKSGIIELLTYSIPLALAGLAGTVAQQLDKIIIADLCPPSEFAEYSIGAIQIPLIGVITTSIMTVLIVELRRSVVSGNIARAVYLFRKCAEKSSMILLPAMIFFFINADYVISLMFTNTYKNSVDPFKVYLLLIPVRTVIFGSLLSALGEQKILMWFALVGLIINAAISIPCVMHFGSVAAAWVTIGVLYLFSVPAYIYVIMKRTKCSIFNIIPLGTYIRILAEWLPVALIMLALNYYSSVPPMMKLFTNFIICAIYGAWRVHGDLYHLTSFKKILNKKNY